uniref:Leucine rich repeat containing 42 n=1 Tax=Poecilia reticulata TaxID=8081 RepID=A0A3P9P625_POERE
SYYYCNCEIHSAIYVRERGSLRRVSDIILAQPKTTPPPSSSSSSSCRRTNPFVLRKEHFIFTYNDEGSLRYTTKSLFDITLLFVTDNIQHVDSLVGFPEQIGDRLFVAAEENRVFLNPDISQKALKLFSDAYGDLVLGSLCLRNRFPLLHERLTEIKTFHSLKSLDLFGCRLGDDHELFHHLTSASLTRLFIGGNHLSDVGLQRLTAPIRMMQKGLDSLELLDVSCNPLSEMALRYLTCLPKLVKLDLGTGLKTTVWNLLGLIHSEKPLNTFDHSGCKTEGWAEQVLNAAPLISEDGKQTNMEKLHFYKPTGNNHLCGKMDPSTTKCLQARNPTCNVAKTKRESSKCDASHQSPPTKTKRSSSLVLTAEDTELLNSY